MLQNYRNLASLGLVSKLDLVAFLEQLKDPRNIRRMGTIAIYPAHSPSSVPDLPPARAQYPADRELSLNKRQRVLGSLPKADLT
ncbi:hypothetical protein AB1E18_013785 [Capra hircus]